MSIGAGERTGGGAWTRRGEWLEVTPGKIITGAEDSEAAIDKWLLETVGMPEKLRLRLRREGAFSGREIDCDWHFFRIVKPALNRYGKSLKCCMRMIFAWLPTSRQAWRFIRMAVA